MKFRAIIAACMLLMMSLSSCSKHEESPNDQMFIRFDVSGKVVDTDGNPIKGITVMAESAESVLTDAEGLFEVHGGGAPSETAAVTIVDEDKGGRKYVARTVMVSLEKYRDGEGWNNGYFRNKEELTVVMMEETVTPAPSGSAK